MYSTELGIEYKYDLTALKFKSAFEFLKNNNLADLPEGWIDLDNGVRVSVQHYISFNEDEIFFESHEKFFDVQYVIEGQEYCGICKRAGLSIRTPYDPKNDITFYENPSLAGKVLLLPGDFIILNPEDVHKPRIATEKKMEIKKIVIKVPVNEI